MSFSKEVKLELTKKTDLPKHCNIATLSSITLSLAYIKDDKLIYKTDNVIVKKEIERLLKTLFLKEELPFKEEGNEIIVFENMQKLFTLCHLSLAKEEIQKDDDFSLILKEECCKKNFIKGIFLTSGSINNPNNAYHFEIICKNILLANDIVDIFTLFNIYPRIIERKGQVIVYLKDGVNITDVLNIMGAYVSQMEFYNVMILKDMRNSVNRIVNCETANLNKTVNAAIKQIRAIEYIRENGGLSQLPEKLLETAKIRLKNPETSLKELGEFFEKPIGKSGINHRLKAIEDFAKELEKKNNKPI